MADVVDLRPPRWVSEVLKREDLPGIKRKIRALLKEAVVYDITNVSDYYWGGTDKEWFEPKTDFSCVRPPFSHFWMEWRRPLRVSSEAGLTVDRMKYGARSGVLGRVHDMEDPEVMRMSAECVGSRYRQMEHV